MRTGTGIALGSLAFSAAAIAIFAPAAFDQLLHAAFAVGCLVGFFAFMGVL